MTQTKVQPGVCPACSGMNYVLSNRNGQLHGRVCECFNCDRCGGEGRLFRQDEKGVSYLGDCDCTVFHTRIKLLNDAGIPGKFVHADLDNYETIHRSQKTARSRCEDFLKDFQKSSKRGNRGLLFMGGPGLGKTHLTVAIIKQLILGQGVPCKFVDFFQLLSEIRHAYSQDQSEQALIVPYIQSRVLVIDELAKGRNTEWELTVLDQFISNRYNAADKVTLFTSNYPREREKKRGGPLVDTSVEQFSDAFTHQSLQERIGPRIVSRIFEMCDIVTLQGHDYRLRGK